MNIKLTDISFCITPHTQRCCLAAFTDWSQSKVTRVGEGEDAEELWIGEVPSGEVLTCPHCKAQFLLSETGDFEWVDPDEFELVDSEEPPLKVEGPIAYDKGPAVDNFGNCPPRAI
jgi:hypothetical protein